jgi:hypothetical protein
MTFLGLSNDTILMQIPYCRTVPLNPSDVSMKYFRFKMGYSSDSGLHYNTGRSVSFKELDILL